MKKRNGFLLIWLQIATAAIFIMGAAFFAIFWAASSHVRKAAVMVDEALLVQSALEEAKYRYTQKEIGLESGAFQEERNGRLYTVRMTVSDKMVGGIAVHHVMCVAEGKDGRFQADMLLPVRS